MKLENYDELEVGSIYHKVVFSESNSIIYDAVVKYKGYEYDNVSPYAFWQLEVKVGNIHGPIVTMHTLDNVTLTKLGDRTSNPEYYL